MQIRMQITTLVLGFLCLALNQVCAKTTTPSRTFTATASTSQITVASVFSNVEDLTVEDVKLLMGNYKFCKEKARWLFYPTAKLDTIFEGLNIDEIRKMFDSLIHELESSDTPDEVLEIYRHYAKLAHIQAEWDRLTQFQATPTWTAKTPEETCQKLKIMDLHHPVHLRIEECNAWWCTRGFKLMMNYIIFPIGRLYCYYRSLVFPRKDEL